MWYLKGNQMECRHLSKIKLKKKKKEQVGKNDDKENNLIIRIKSDELIMWEFKSA